MATYTIQSGDTLSKIAAANNTDVNTLATSNNIANPNLIIAGKTLNLPDAKPTITADSLQSASTIKFPEPTPTIDQSGAMMAGATTSINDIIKQLTPTEQTPTEKLQQSSLDAITGLTGELGNKGNDQLAAEQAAGIPDLNKQFADLNGQILTKNAEYNDISKKYDTLAASLEGQGRGLTVGMVTGQQGAVRKQQAAVLNEKAAEVGMITARAQALKGQIEVAQNTVNRSIDLKYSTIESKINTYQAQLNALIPTLNKEEKIRAQAQQVLLDQQKQALQDKKDEETKIQNTMLQAVQAGITDSRVLAQISNAKTSAEALQIAGPLIGKTVQEEKSLDNAYKRAQIANIQSEIANRGSSGDSGKYDPAEILAYAQQYAATGQIPSNLPKGSFGIVSQVAKEVPQSNGTLVNKVTGIKDSKIGTVEQNDLARLYNITENVKKLAELDKKRIGGVVAGTLGKIFGSNAQAEYLTKRKAIVDDIQRMQSGAALSETEQKFYSDYLPARFSESLFLGQDSGKKIENFAKEMTTKLDNALKTNNLAIYGFSKVKIGDSEYKVGDIISNGSQNARVNPDGTLTLIQ